MYSGQIVSMPCNRGGFQYPQSLDLLGEFGLVSAKNINLHEGGRQKRGGTTHRLASTVSGSPQITGLYLFEYGSTQKIIIGTTDGKLWDSADLTTAKKTGLTTGKFFSFETFNNKCYICNVSNVVQVYDGSTIAAITNDPTDWGTGSPRQIIKHGRGNSERLWAIGVSGYEKRVYISPDGSDNFSDATVTTLTIDTPDVGGILAAKVFGDRLFLFSKNHTYVIDDTDTNVSNWGYEEAQWLGGVGSWRLAIRTPNDIVCMTAEGDIYSVSAVQQYGDYKSASIARPAFIDRWIRLNTNIANLNTLFHGIYDPELRAIKIFVTRSGVSVIDTCLVYFIDRPPAEAWAIHDSSGLSGYKASAACLGIKSTGQQVVLTGDYAGWVWFLEDTLTYADNALGYYSGFTLPPMSFKNVKIKKRFDGLTLITKPEGDWNLSIKTTIDDVYREIDTINLSGTGSVFGTGVFGTATYGSTDYLQKSANTRRVGKRIQYEIFNNNAGQDFFISQIIVAYKELGMPVSEET